MMEKTIKFPVRYSSYESIYVTVPVSEAEYNDVDYYTWIPLEYERGFESCEDEDLADLYQRVIDAAVDKLAHMFRDDRRFIDRYLGGVYDFDAARTAVKENFNLIPEWPDI